MKKVVVWQLVMAFIVWAIFLSILHYVTSDKILSIFLTGMVVTVIGAIVAIEAMILASIVSFCAVLIAVVIDFNISASADIICIDTLALVILILSILIARISAINWTANKSAVLTSCLIQFLSVLLLTSFFLLC